MVIRRRYARGVAAAAATMAMVLVAGCGSGGATQRLEQDQGATITVALASAPPPKAALDEFTKETGIKVKWTNIDWDSLQTKISAAATSKTYFADATDVDWSRVGQLGKLGWFYPMDEVLDTKAMESDMPQLASFTSDGKVVGIPYDASFMVTTVNKEMFDKAGVTHDADDDRRVQRGPEAVKAKGVVKYPLNIPFAAAEGLSTYWYQTTGALRRHRSSTARASRSSPTPSSPGYKAAEWMVSALKDGLVPPGNINVTDSQGQQTLMAKGQVASTFSDYSGTVGSCTPCRTPRRSWARCTTCRRPAPHGVGPNLNNPDGIGIPTEAKYPKAAAKFIEWFTDTDTQIDFAGVNGPDKVLPGYPIPSRLSAVKVMTEKGKLIQGEQLQKMLKGSTRPVFPEGAPSWYPQFSRAVYTNLHAAATGSKSVSAAIGAIADTANSLAEGS